MRTRFRTILGILAVYLSLAGLVTFSLFILEESFQTVMFGTWPAQDAGRWDIVLEGTDLMEDFKWWMTSVNLTVGWIQPLAFVSYRAYAKSETFYIRSLRAKVLQNQPELMVGRKVKIRFIIRSTVKRGENKYILSNGRLRIITPERLSGVLDVEGVVKKTEVGYELVGIHGGTVRYKTQ